MANPRNHDAGEIVCMPTSAELTRRRFLGGALAAGATGLAVSQLVAMAITAVATVAEGANLWLFDMGSADSPVWPGFAQVTPETTYTVDRGYGWLNEADQMRAYVCTRIDGLAIDDVSGLYNRTGAFQVDVPNGDYTVWVLSGAMGNIYRQRYMRAPHALALQGEVVETIEYPEEKLFEVADYDWRPGDDIWEVFIQPRFAWHKHEATATQGKITLGFHNQVYFPVNAIVVAERGVAKRVQKEIDRIDQMRRAAFYGIWEENRPDSFWYGVLKKCPHWDYRGRPVPSREQLFEEQRRMLEKHPDTVFICAHMGGHAENLGYLGELLDRHPNLYVDTTAYEPLMGQEPEESRAFLVRYQDRVLLGTDNCPGSSVDASSSSKDLRIAVLRMRTRRLFYESDSEQVSLDDFWLRRPGYTIRGVNLPSAAIGKIYRENACRVIPGFS